MKSFNIFLLLCLIYVYWEFLSIRHKYIHSVFVSWYKIICEITSALWLHINYSYNYNTKLYKKCIITLKKVSYWDVFSMNQWWRIRNDCYTIDISLRKLILLHSTTPVLLSREKFNATNPNVHMFYQSSRFVTTVPYAQAV